ALRFATNDAVKGWDALLPVGIADAAILPF
ncbi:MAG: hypothetical protein QOE51_1724, partial [Actinoplanes sp.]|nr:hypothetical protein [Actinoplanes sp.]